MFQGLNQGHQIWCQVSLCPDPSHQPMSPSKNANHIVITPTESGLDEISDKELKDVYVNTFKEIKEDKKTTEH